MCPDMVIVSLCTIIESTWFLCVCAFVYLKFSYQLFNIGCCYCEDIRKEIISKLVFGNFVKYSCLKSFLLHLSPLKPTKNDLKKKPIFERKLFHETKKQLKKLKLKSILVKFCGRFTKEAKDMSKKNKI